jgi:protease II
MLLENNPDYFLARNKNYKLFTIKDIDVLKGVSAKLIIKPEEGQLFEDMDIFKDHLIIYYKVHMKPYILLYSIKTQTIDKIEINKPGEIQPGLNKVYR